MVTSLHYRTSMVRNLHLILLILTFVVTLRYPSFDHTMAQDTLQSFLASLDESLPKDSPARKPNLAIYISYSLKNKVMGDPFGIYS